MALKEGKCRKDVMQPLSVSCSLLKERRHQFAPNENFSCLDHVEGSYHISESGVGPSFLGLPTLVQLQIIVDARGTRQAPQPHVGQTNMMHLLGHKQTNPTTHAVHLGKGWDGL